MSIVLDVVLVAVIVAICINAYIHGLIISLFNLLSSLAAMVISFVLYPVFTSIFKALPVYGWIREPVLNSLTQASVNSGVSTAEGFLELLRLPGLVSDRILNQLNESGLSNSTSALIDETSNVITDFIIQIISVVIIFIIVKAVLIFAKKLIKNITKLPIVHQADKAGGIVFGLLEAFVILTVVGALFTLFSGKIDGGVIEVVKGSVVGRFFYDNNLLVMLLSGRI